MNEIISLQSPLYFSVWALTYFVVQFILSKSLLKEKHWPTTIAMCIVSLSYLSSKFLNNIIPIVIPISIIVFSIVGICIIQHTQQTLYKTIGSVLIISVMTILGEALVVIPVSFVLGGLNAYIEFYKNIPACYDDKINYYISILSMITTALFLSGIIKLIIGKKQGTMNYTVKYLFFLWLPVTHVISFIIFLIILSKQQLGFSAYGVVAWIYLMIILILDILTFVIVNKYEQIEQENKKYEQQILQNKLDYQQTLLIKENQKEVSKIRHDILNILSTAKGFIEIEKYDKALNILQNTTDDLYSHKGVPLCSNDTLNTILQVKSSQAEKENIKLKIEIEEEATLNIDDYSLCRIIGNLVDNAIHGVQKVQSDSIKLCINITPEKIKIVTENECDKQGLVPTKGHGKGKGIIKEIAGKYSGSYSFHVKNSIYETTTVLKNIKI